MKLLRATCWSLRTVQSPTLRAFATQKPWHRHEADKAPADKVDKKIAGKVLTTPSRLLKLIIPLRALDDAEPLALLVHPQQPLSYLERLIQAEVPPITTDGRQRPPNVEFHAEDASAEVDKRGGPGQGGVEVYGKASTSRQIQWSSSTEMGDFIRDAARGQQFAIRIEGAPRDILIGVPSFHDRTFYLRLRLRKTASALDGMTKLKKECDDLAHLSAQRLALGGFGGLMLWWALVYHLTFQTEYGWDAVEPVTYLVGLSTIMMGYLWFLYHNREVSYRAALNMTVSHRQQQLYVHRGFDVAAWEALIQEANSLRKDIKVIAEEYDVEWDEADDTGSEEVAEALKEREEEE